MAKNRIKWEEPPAPVKKVPTPRLSKWGQIAAQVRTRPGEWALVETKETVAKANQLAFGLRTKILKLGPGRFEAKNSGRKVYLRYLGAEDLPQDAHADTSPTQEGSTPDEMDQKINEHYGELDSETPTSS